MNYVITSGDTYIMRNEENVLSPTGNIDNALIFSSKDLANESMRCLPKYLKGRGFSVKRIIGFKFEEANPSEVVQSEKNPVDSEYNRLTECKTGRGVPFKAEDPEWLDNLKKDIVKVDEVLGGLPDVYYNATRDLNDVNMELADLEHAIEFLKPNAVQKCYLESEMKNARQKRRSLKDAKFIAEVVLSFKWEDWGSGRIPKMMEAMETREYVPRIRKDLFE